MKKKLRFFIHKPPPALKHNPLAALLADDCFLAKSDNPLHSLNDLCRDQITALISLVSPFKRIIGVSLQGGLNPPVSPYPP